MFKAEITKITKQQIFGVCDHREHRIDTSKLMRKPKKGEFVEGILAGGAIVAEKFVSK